jgi:hypothetical protein
VTDPKEALRRMLEIEQLALPRLLVAIYARDLANALRTGDPAGPEAVEARAAAAATELWPQVGAAMEGVIRRTGALVPPEEDDLFVAGLEWASGDDPANPLALALVAQGAAALAAAMDRSQERLRAVEVTLEAGGPQAAVAAAGAIGASVVDLLDLDVEDYEAELVAYVEQDQTPEALDELARQTGELELRRIARDLMADLELADIPHATAAVQLLAQGPPPADAAEDALWLPTMLALADEAIALAMVDEAASDGAPPTADA